MQSMEQRLIRLKDVKAGGPCQKVDFAMLLLIIVMPSAVTVFTVSENCWMSGKQCRLRSDAAE